MILKTEILENLLIKNWTQFVDSHKLLAFVLSSLRDMSLPPIFQAKFQCKNNVQIAVSQAKFKKNLLSLWVDYVVPKSETSYLTGTCEVDLDLSTGQIVNTNIIGSLITKKD